MPITTVQPYLNFDGRCEEAIEFYKTAVGAKVEMLMRMSDSPEAHGCAPGNENKIMHASLRVGDSVVMASDCGCAGQVKFGGFSLAISVSEEAELNRTFDALAVGGKVEMPLGKTFWTERFGVVTDRFGVSWMLNLGIPENK